MTDKTPMEQKLILIEVVFKGAIEIVKENIKIHKMTRRTAQDKFIQEFSQEHTGNLLEISGYFTNTDSLSYLMYLLTVSQYQDRKYTAIQTEIEKKQMTKERYYELKEELLRNQAPKGYMSTKDILKELDKII